MVNKVRTISSLEFEIYHENTSYFAMMYFSNFKFADDLGGKIYSPPNYPFRFCIYALGNQKMKK